VIRDVPIQGWPKPFLASGSHWGPRDNSHCPCGSLRRSRSCHMADDRRWLTPTPEPLLDDEPTGYSHPGCYAAASRDCSSKLTSEHWLSASVLKALEPVTISGAAWQAGGQQSLPVTALGANVLCERHNGALSRLDTTAGQVFHVLRDYQGDLRAQSDPHGPEFALFDGLTLERWLLKLFWGGAAARVFGTDSGPITSLSDTVPPEDLVAALFRGGSLPNGSGMFVTSRPDAVFSPEAEVDVSGFAEEGGRLREGSVAFGPVALRFSFGPPIEVAGRPVKQHPQAIFMRGSAAPTSQKILALGWPDVGSWPVILTRQGDGTALANPSDV
jgi:hypothetical protein